MYRSLDCFALYPFRAAIARPIATKAWWSSSVMSGGTSVFVYPYGQRMSSPLVWNVMWALICWIPPTTRLRTKSRTARTSGADHALGPRYVSDDGLRDEPAQHAQWYP